MVMIRSINFLLNVHTMENLIEGKAIEDISN
jgi:hypothetical protein